MTKSTDPLADLAKHVSDKAMLSDTPFSETLDAFGKLTTYHALILKHRGKTADTDDDAPTMERFAEEFRQEGVNGRSGSNLPAGRRTRADA